MSSVSEALSYILRERNELRQENERLRRELADAYAELRKQWPAMTAVFDRDVHDRARNDGSKR